MQHPSYNSSPRSRQPRQRGYPLAPAPAPSSTLTAAAAPARNAQVQSVTSSVCPRSAEECADRARGVDLAIDAADKIHRPDSGPSSCATTCILALTDQLIDHQDALRCRWPRRCAGLPWRCPRRSPLPPLAAGPEKSAASSSFSRAAPADATGYRHSAASRQYYFPALFFPAPQAGGTSSASRLAGRAMTADLWDKAYQVVFP